MNNFKLILFLILILVLLKDFLNISLLPIINIENMNNMNLNNSNNSLNDVKKSNIPEGQEDLYILKSKIVPPVCPACPACPQISNTTNKCTPCPPCGRCPEPQFECMKVPNYNSSNLSGSGTSQTIPRPVLANFTQFGM